MEQSDYVNTGVRLPATLYRAIKDRAKQEGTTMAHIIRESLLEYMLEKSDEIETPSSRKDNVDSFFLIGSDPGHSGLGDGSVDHDKHLYDKRQNKPCDESL